MRTPTKQLKEAYDELMRRYIRDIECWGKANVSVSYRHFELSAYGDINRMIIDMVHYDTWILSLDVSQYGVIVNRVRGWSNTDRDNMNGLLRLLNCPSEFYRRDYDLMCDLSTGAFIGARSPIGTGTGVLA